MIGITVILRFKPVFFRRLITQLPGAEPRAGCVNDLCRWLAGLCLLTTLLLGACSNRTELDSSVEKLTFNTLKGEQIAIRDAGGPMLINFWSTSCAVCLDEMPDLADLHTDYAGTGFQVVAVAMPYDPPNHVLELAQQRQLPFPVALDIKGEAVTAFASVKGTPTSYLLDAEGQLVQRYVGAIAFKGLRRELDRLLDVS
jgi:thiol-disulfide isomerase/thioredoxin